MDTDDEQTLQSKETNHIMYAEQHRINHSLSSGILTFLSVVRCRKEIGKFYRENEHFRELISVMKQKYGSKYDTSIVDALNQVINVMFDRYQRKTRKQHRRQQQQQQTIGDEDDEIENRIYQKCSNSLCQMIENEVNS